jgi:hypothetical protein
MNVNINALTLIKMNGESKTISWDPYPDNYGEFMTANIQVVNFKSRFKPFTIVPPEGVILQPLDPGARKLPLPDVFFYALGHIINWKHYEQTDNTLTQIYLAGMTDTKDLTAELVPLARSWLQAPELLLASQDYESLGYEKTQRAYVVNYNQEKETPGKLNFELKASKNSPLVNPAFVIKGWGKSHISLKIDGKEITRDKNFRFGYEWSETGFNLILWIKTESNTPMKFSIEPIER